MEEKEQEVKYHQNGAHPATEPASKRARLQATISLTPTPVSRSAADQHGEKSVGQQRGPSRQKIHAGDGVQPHEADKTHHTSNVIMGTSAGAFYQRSRQRGSASALNLDAEKQLQQLMPGEALRAWLEENQTAVQEEPLIEDVHEEAPHKPSAAELAADAACDRLLSLLSGLTAARDSIAQATEGALVTAAAGAAPRAVRMILDAVNGAPRPRERLPFLYLLDSALKAEARNHQNAEATNSRDVPPPSFPRAVGAALLPLVTALLGDPSVTSKMEKVLRIWHRDGLVASVLVDSALEVITAGAETQRNGENEEEQPVSQALYTEGEAFELLRSVPMNAVLTLNYTMPGGKKQIVRPPNDSLSSDIRPDDWGTAAPLAFHVPDSPAGMVSAETRQKAFDANGFSGGSFSSDGIGELKDVSPWRRQWVELEEKTERLLSARRQAPNPAAMNHLDEFDLGLLKGVMGAVSTTKGNPHVGMQAAAAAPPPPLGSPPPLPGDLVWNPPPAPTRSPVQDEYINWRLFSSDHWAQDIPLPPPGAGLPPPQHVWPAGPLMAPHQMLMQMQQQRLMMMPNFGTGFGGVAMGMTGFGVGPHVQGGGTCMQLPGAMAAEPTARNSRNMHMGGYNYPPYNAGPNNGAGNWR